MFDIYNNKYAFLNKKPKGLFIFFLLLTLIFTFILIAIYKIKIYDNYQTKGYVSCNECCFITTHIPTNIDIEKIKINNKNIVYKVDSIETIIDQENYLSYKKLVLKTDLKFTNDGIIELNFYYNKQRIIEKIKEKMF